MLILLPNKLLEWKWSLIKIVDGAFPWRGDAEIAVQMNPNGIMVEITLDHKSQPPIEQLKDEFKTITQRWPRAARDAVRQRLNTAKTVLTVGKRS